MEQYCIYLRKSRADMEAEAHGEGETLARHERALLDLARRLHLNVTEIYREIVSGDSIAARPIMQRVLSEVEQGLWTGVLVMEVERLARGDTIDQGIISQTFKFSDTKIITPLKTYDPANEYDEEYFEFGLFMSRREYKTINRRLQAGHKASAAEGKWAACLAPYGYQRVKLQGEKGWTLEPVEEQAAVVRLIFELYVNGINLPDGSVQCMTLGKIVRYLESEKISAPSGGALWSRDTVSHIIKNPVYAGWVRWGMRSSRKRMVDGSVRVQKVVMKSGEYALFKGRHDAIISQELFDKANEEISRSVRPASQHGQALQNPLAHLVFCSKCGHAMIRRGPASGHGYLACITHGCSTVGVSIPLVEQRLLSELSKWLDGYELSWNDQLARSAVSGSDVKRKSLNKEKLNLEKLKCQLEKTHDLLEQGVYDTETFLARSRSLADRINAAHLSIEQLTKELAAAEVAETQRKEIIPKVRGLLDAYDTLSSVEEKNRLLREVIERIVFTKEAVDGVKPATDEFEIEIYPRLPHKTER